MASKIKVEFPKAFAPPWHRATINPPAPSLPPPRPRCSDPGRSHVGGELVRQFRLTG